MDNQFKPESLNLSSPLNRASNLFLQKAPRKIWTKNF